MRNHPMLFAIIYDREYSNVWFTLQDGRLSEVYYPRIDTPSVRNLDFVVTDVDIFTPIWSGPLEGV